MLTVDILANRLYTHGNMPTGKNVTGKLDTTADSAIAISMNSLNISERYE